MPLKDDRMDDRDLAAVKALSDSLEKQMNAGFAAVSLRLTDMGESLREEIAATRRDREAGDNTLAALRQVDLERAQQVDNRLSEQDRQIGAVTRDVAGLRLDLQRSIDTLRHDITTAVTEGVAAMRQAASQSLTSFQESHAADHQQMNVRVGKLDGSDGRVAKLEGWRLQTIAYAAGAAAGASSLVYFGVQAIGG